MMFVLIAYEMLAVGYYATMSDCLADKLRINNPITECRADAKRI
jgi:hypothetical protein